MNFHHGTLKCFCYTTTMQVINVLKGKRVLLGVSGSIACFKAVDLASTLTQAGADVDVILTESAARFVSPLSYRSVTGRPAYTDMWDLSDHVRHVGLGEAADLMLIAPATANTIAKLASGQADNLLTVTALAARCPVVLAPAMDGGMWDHPATQANVQTLKERGVILAGPAVGRMASGLSGLGRMVESQELLAQARLVLSRGGILAGRKVVVTTGPTREPIDPVRFITNRSSGKQGIAVAQAALDAGASVILITGPICEDVPHGATIIRVELAEEMSQAVLANTDDADALFMVAAVADFKPVTTAERKIKKSDESNEELEISLTKTTDILMAVKEKRQFTGFPRVVLGFAAETHNAADYGREKLLRKGLDFIAVNDVTAEGAGFAVDTNRVLLLGLTGVIEEMPLQSKTAVAESLIHHVSETLRLIDDRTD